MSSIFNSSFIDTILCMVLVFALLSLLVSNLTEWLSLFLKQRGTMLYNAILGMFNDRVNVNFGKLLYNHPAIDRLKKDKHSLPQYISDSMFASTIIEVIADFKLPPADDAKAKAAAIPDDIFSRFEYVVNNLKSTNVQMALANMVQKSKIKGQSLNPQSPLGTQLSELEKALITWYNGYMERVTGWYKESIRKFLFWIALAVTLIMNVNAIHVFQTIYRSPDLRAQITPVAEAVAKEYEKLAQDSTLTKTQRANLAVQKQEIEMRRVGADTAAIKHIDTMLAKVQQVDSILRINDSTQKVLLKQSAHSLQLVYSLGLPIGWKRNIPPLSFFYTPAQPPSESIGPASVPGTTFSWSNLFSYLMGIVITAYAISLGAPFWFDLLVKVVNLRRAGVKPKTSDSNTNNS